MIKISDVTVKDIQNMVGISFRFRLVMEDLVTLIKDIFDSRLDKSH